MTSFTSPFVLPFPTSTMFTSPCRFSALDELSLEDDYEHMSRYTAGIFDGSTSSTPWLNDRRLWSRRQLPEFQAFSASYDEIRPEILHAHRTRRREGFSINEEGKMYEPFHHDYLKFTRNFDKIPFVSSARSSSGVRLPGLSELFFGKADIESHRSPRKRRRRGSTFQQDPSRFPEHEISDCEESKAGIYKPPFINRDATTAKSRKKFQREISTDSEEQEMNQSYGESSHQWMHNEDIDYEEADPCPEKYRDPLWEEHIRSEGSTTRSAKGKERADPLDPGYYSSYNGPEQYLGQSYNIAEESSHAYTRGYPGYSLPPAEGAFMKRAAPSPERKYFHSGSPSKVGTTTPKKHVNYSRNFNNPHISKRDPYALSYDELKRARHTLQREREALEMAKELLTSEMLQFDAIRRSAGYSASTFSDFISHFQKVTNLLSSSGVSFHNSDEYGVSFGEQSSSNHSYYDEPHVAGEISSISSSPSIAPQNQIPDGARQMLDRYNRNWELLSIRDPNVPYPTPSGLIGELKDPSHIHSPWTSPPCTWSQDKIMQTNAETFFQHGFGICPIYSEHQGVLRTLGGVPPTTDKQLHELQNYLKKERNRWHPDKLLLRSREQGPLTNDTLMTCPASRAVLQAVIDLLHACRNELARRMKIYQKNH